MFGDIGHGGLLFAFGLWMCYANDELRAKKSAFLPLLDFR
jgi:vacuolar-type H+-ATPase subunit I/STV1